MPNDKSPFRHWVRNIWIENTQERQNFHELPYSMEEYWNKYKWWLKREYRFQQNQQKP